MSVMMRRMEEPKNTQKASTINNISQTLREVISAKETIMTMIETSMVSTIWIEMKIARGNKKGTPVPSAPIVPTDLVNLKDMVKDLTIGDLQGAGA